MPSPGKSYSRTKSHPSKAKRFKMKYHVESDIEKFPEACYFNLIEGKRKLRVKIDETSTPETILASIERELEDSTESQLRATIERAWNASTEGELMIERPGITFKTIVLKLGLLTFERTLEYREAFWPIWVHLRTGDLRNNTFDVIPDNKRYKHLRDAKEFFPWNMFALDDKDFKNWHRTMDIVRQNDLQYMLRFSNKVPIVFEHMFVKEMESITWRNQFVVLKDDIMYCSESYMTDTSEMYRLLDIKDFDVFHVDKGKEFYRARWNNCFALKKKLSYEKDEDKDEDETIDDFYMFSCRLPEAKLCWMTVMRIAKYGAEIRGEYGDYTYNSLQDYGYRPDASERTKIAMAFCDKVSMHPEKNIAGSLLSHGPDGQIPELSSPRCSLDLPLYDPLATPQKVNWLLDEFARGINGACMVRDAVDISVKLVLSYVVVKEGDYSTHQICYSIIKMKQVQIQNNHVGEEPTYELSPVYYTLDGGENPLFYDLLQLLEYYQLNDGLATKLTAYVGKNGKVYTTDCKEILNPKPQ